MKFENPNDLRGSIQTARFQFSTKVDKSGMGRHQRYIKDEKSLKETLENFLSRNVMK